MKRDSIWMLGSAFLFFALGVGWGVWSLRLKAQRIAHSTPLRVLCAENWLATEALNRFSQEHGVRIEQYTYSHPSDFLRQMANSDGKVDVVCTSSLLVRSLVRSHWLKKVGYANLPSMKMIAVDFAHLPYDTESQYSAPLFWNLYGFFGKEDQPRAATWKQTWQSKKLSVWGDELNVLHLMNSLELNSEERASDEMKNESLNVAFKKFMKASIEFLKPAAPATSAEALLGKFDWIELPLSRVSQWLGGNSPYHFWLPEDGATVEVGVLGIGEKATQVELAKAFIDEMLATPQALQTHKQIGAGVVHSSLSGQTSIPPLQKAEALRLFPLNRLRFPDLDVEDLPRFQKVFNDANED